MTNQEKHEEMIANLLKSGYAVENKNGFDIEIIVV
jgi:hypothetical protein